MGGLQEMDPPKVCPRCDGESTLTKLSHPYYGFGCQDCEFVTWLQRDGTWHSPTPQQWHTAEEALDQARGWVGSLLHVSHTFDESERRDILGHIYYALGHVLRLRAG